jgi:hypothetical protein
MINDLDQFEKKILRAINVIHNTNYNYKHLSEWSSRDANIKKNLRDGELEYNVLGVFVAINPNNK